MQNLLFTLTIIAPVFVMVFLGALLRGLKVIDDTFVRSSSKVVFNVALPALLLTETAQIDFSANLRIDAALIYALATLLVFGLGWAMSYLLTSDTRSRGPFIQGGFRSNVAIVGLPIISMLLNQQALAEAIIILALMMPLFNILSVIALTVPLHKGGTLRWTPIIMNILTNPLILAVVAGSLLALSPLKLPGFVMASSNYLGQMTFPLALLSIGATLTRDSMHGNLTLTAWAVALKTVVLPALVALGAWFFGLPNRLVMVVFVFGAAPTAVASFIMAQAMDNDRDLAGSIVVVTTIVSVISLSAGIFFFRSIGWV
jgi:predicted permease